MSFDVLLFLYILKKNEFYYPSVIGLQYHELPRVPTLIDPFIADIVAP